MSYLHIFLASNSDSGYSSDLNFILGVALVVFIIWRIFFKKSEYDEKEFWKDFLISMIPWGIVFFIAIFILN